MNYDSIGDFIDAAGNRAGPVAVHITEVVRGPNEPGLDDLRGWAVLPIEFAGRVAIGNGECRLELPKGRTVLVLLGNVQLPSGRVTFSRRA